MVHLYIVDNLVSYVDSVDNEKGRGIFKNPPALFVYINRRTVTILVYVAGSIPIPLLLLIAFTICPFPI